MTRPIAPCAAILDAVDEAGARAILARLFAPDVVEIVRSGWEPYRKFGPQSRIWIWWRLPEGDPVEHFARLTALAEAAIPPADRGLIDRRLDADDPAAPRLEIVVAGDRVEPAVPGLLWLDLELDLAAEVQADLAAALTS